MMDAREVFNRIISDAEIRDAVLELLEANREHARCREDYRKMDDLGVISRFTISRNLHPCIIKLRESEKRLATAVAAFDP